MTGAYAHNAAWGWQDVPQFRPALLLLLLLMGGAQACTTIGVGRLATTDGSVFCSHSNDGEGDTDPRLVRIPSSDWPKGSVRDIYFSPESFPRYVGNARANATYPLPPYAPASGNTNGNGNGNGARARARTIRDFLHRTCLICRPCHSEVHRLHDEMELAERFPTVERLLEDEDLVRFCKWASGQKCGRYSLSHG